MREQRKNAKSTPSDAIPDVPPTEEVKNGILLLPLSFLISHLDILDIELTAPSPRVVQARTVEKLLSDELKE